MTSIIQRLRELGHAVPIVKPPAGRYVATNRIGNLLFVAGQVSRDADGAVIAGRLGVDASVEQGARAAQAAAVHLLGLIAEAIEGTAEIRAIARLNVYVASSSDFTQQPQVADGASALLLEVLGDGGRHARTAIGVPVLPRGAMVEVDAIVELEDLR